MIKMEKVVTAEFKKLADLCPRPGETFVDQNGNAAVLVLCDDKIVFLTSSHPKAFHVNFCASLYRRQNFELVPKP